MRRIPTAFAVLFLIGSSSPARDPLHYPHAMHADVTDSYFGTSVPDPFRWLENDTAKAVADWVAAENRVTFDYLAGIPFRQRLRTRLDEIYNFPKYSVPSRSGPYYTFFKNDGLQNQSVAYIRQGLEGTPEVLLDPNTFSTDGTIRLAGLAFAKDARHFAYGISHGGSDWEEYFVRETATGRQLADHIRWAKISGITWYKDGFFYSRYDAPADTSTALTSKNENHKIYYHLIGTGQEQDRLVYEEPAHPLRFNTTAITDDERFLILYVSDRGAGKDGNAVFVRDMEKNDSTFIPVITTFDDDCSVVDHIGDRLLILTNRHAQRYRLVLVDPAHPAEERWQEILPEQSEPLVSVASVGGKLIATYLKDVSHRVYVYDQSGRRENEIVLPTFGTTSGFGGEKIDSTVFYSFTSFTFPQTIYRYDLRTRTSTLYRSSEVKFDPAAYETRQVFVTSRDGTRVPMFIVCRKGLELDGRNPTLLYGYGGFNVSELPGFSSTRVALLEQGVVFAVANIRGGGEYGEEWHRAAIVLRRQNAFDDFIAAAEWLKTNGYTSTEKLGLWGISNGGLLVGAVMTQRPDLAKVAIPQAGVMDMLRYHKFTIGWNWKPDFGSSEDSVQFRYLYGYSPVHNLHGGTQYPATFITTADHDDRVVPAHSFKFAAALQEATAGPNPALIRIETQSGHGASNTTKALDIVADVYSFFLYNVGADVRY
jgi:prolyl oligopeptidase